MAIARATANGGFWNGDTFVSYEEGQEFDGDLAVLMLLTPTLPFVDVTNGEPPVVAVVDGDAAAAQEGTS
jgi:hypothetical protein